MKERTEIVPKKMVYLLFVCTVLLGLSLYMPQPAVAPFISGEVHFYDPSTGGLKIMPASCASPVPSVGYLHGKFLTTTGDAYGLKSLAGTTQYGAYATATSKYICITNTTGSAVFIPAKSAAELNAFKAAPPAGVTVYY
jgi:hypothetical protein